MNAAAPTPGPATCDRQTFHIHHDLADGSTCPGHVPAAALTPEQVRAHADTARLALSDEAQKAAAYAYWSGYEDKTAGRPYSNTWEPNDTVGGAA